jgi:hypothetical protein
VPAFSKRLSLAFVFLNNNLLSSFPGFDNTPSLNYAYLHNNQITGVIPRLGDSSQSPNLTRLIAFNNQLNGYASGSFIGLKRLELLDLARNSLYEFDLNNIIDDLHTNYLSSPRSRVTINLQSQTNAIGYSPSVDSLSEREKEVAEKIVFLRSKGWVISLG